MIIVHCEVHGWNTAMNAARQTVGLPWRDGEPSDKFKHEMCKAEHSPLRMVEYVIVADQVPMWVTVHLVRHHIGIEKFVRTQRTDRTGSPIPRGEHPQGELNSMMIHINAQALINISKVRLCNKASKETHELWKLIVDAVSEIDPIVTQYCVPSCVYRGVCGERDCCGWIDTSKGTAERERYINLFKRKEQK